MRYMLFYPYYDEEAESHKTDRVEFEDFEDMMAFFTLCAGGKNSCIVIEPDQKKVLCYYTREGKMMINNQLLDELVFEDNENGTDSGD